VIGIQHDRGGAVGWVTVAALIFTNVLKGLSSAAGIEKSKPFTWLHL